MPRAYADPRSRPKPRADAGQPTKHPWSFHCGGHRRPAGRDLPLTLSDGRKLEDGVLLLTKSTDRIVFTNVPPAPFISLNRGFSAPVRLTVNYSADDLSLLAARDNDPFNRCRRCRPSPRKPDCRRHGLERPSQTQNPAPLVTAMREILASSSSPNPHFRAFPSPCRASRISPGISARIIDHDAIFSARQALRLAIGGALRASLARVYNGMASVAPYSPDAASAGRRTLRNACLDYIAVTPAPRCNRACRAQYGMRTT